MSKLYSSLLILSLLMLIATLVFQVMEMNEYGLIETLQARFF